jgi:hypothetical protein
MGRAVRNLRPHGYFGAGRLAIEVVEQATEPVAPEHRPIPYWRRARDRALLLDTLVRPGMVVVTDVLGQDPYRGYRRHPQRNPGTRQSGLLRKQARWRR